MSNNPATSLAGIRRIALTDARMADAEVDTTALNGLEDMSEEEGAQAIDEFYSSFMYDGL